MENVFQTVPHDSKYGSGVPTQLHDQRLDFRGRHPHNGQRIP
ncbi:MAG TPA: hypothetical protein VKA59_12875 [Vicinamibacterales bacterium]|nr:hypothetical protein [Vicinamibacterales bacterium]